MTDLTDTELAMLDLERQWWKYPGAKEGRIADEFGLSPTRYYVQLNALIDRPEAMAHDSLLVKRLLRLREERKWQRSARRLGFVR